MELHFYSYSEFIIIVVACILLFFAHGANGVLDAFPHAIRVALCNYTVK